MDLELELNRSKAALDELESVVGKSFLLRDPVQIRMKCRDLTPKSELALAYCYPGSVQEVQSIVKIAGKTGLKIWPVSRGLNWGYGAATPAQGGTIVMSLERMNRILEVNRDLAYVEIEPGVTYRQLYHHLAKNEIPLWLDATDGPADGSVIGNALERGIGETDYGDHFGNLCGLEVVLPDGSLIQTGGGPMNTHRSWHTYKWGVGPYLEGLFSQSNFGVVTRVGLWLRPKPEYFTSCVFELKDERNFPALIDGLRHLQLNGALLSKVHLVNETAARAVAVDNYRDQERLLRGFKFAPWTFAAGLYGTRSQVRADVKEIKRTLGRLGRLEFIDDRKMAMLKILIKVLGQFERSKWLNGMANWITRVLIRKPLSLLRVFPHIHAIEKGCPSDFFVKHAYFKSKVSRPKDEKIDPVRDNCGLIWLGPMVPLCGRDVSDFISLVEPLFKKFGFELYVALMVGNPRTAVVLLSVFYDKADSSETMRAEQLYFEIGRLTQSKGYQQYRTSTMYMPEVLKSAPEFAAFCKKLKGAIDPMGTIAPGKYGI